VFNLLTIQKFIRGWNRTFIRFKIPFPFFLFIRDVFNRLTVNISSVKIYYRYWLKRLRCY